MLPIIPCDFWFTTKQHNFYMFLLLSVTNHFILKIIYRIFQFNHFNASIRVILYFLTVALFISFSTNPRLLVFRQIMLSISRVDLAVKCICQGIMLVQLAIETIKRIKMGRCCHIRNQKEWKRLCRVGQWSKIQYTTT